jgi:leucyl aminopeptidase
MTDLPNLNLVTFTPEMLREASGAVAVIVGRDGKLEAPGARLNGAMRGALKRFIESDGFDALKLGEVKSFAFPAGVVADVVILAKLDKSASNAERRKAGAAMAKAAGNMAMTIALRQVAMLRDIVLGAMLRRYDYTAQKSDPGAGAADIQIAVLDPEAAKPVIEDAAAQAQGVYFTRDLVNAPANVLTTTAFADQLVALSALGVEVEVLEEAELEKLGMRTLLAVGQGSESPSKVVVMQWKGAGGDPLALVGKGVVFDTGGISLKPAAGMEEMTMDMGGAGTVAGVMKTLALRKAKAHVVGLVGLVENMPDGKATRPGDVVTSMKGDTVEVINTDAEGRLVLADVLWYAQERFSPTGVIDLATLTGAIIIGLGHENAGVFSNDDTFAKAFLKAAQTEGEGAWQMPLGQAYDDQLKSRIADMKNVGGRPAGSITAAQFLQRFIREGQPWIHLDIAGTASLSTENDLGPKGATGWGVRTLDRLVRNLED